mgnify:CR=1 FL=1
MSGIAAFLAGYGAMSIFIDFCKLIRGALGR